MARSSTTNGELPPPLVHEPHGFMSYCYYVYYLGDKVADGDIYGVDIESNWTLSSFDFDFAPAHFAQYAGSDTVTKDSIFASTPTRTSTTGCSSPFTIGIGAGPISVSTDYKVCSSNTAYAIGVTSAMATWYGNQAHHVRHVEDTFVQKVAHGSVPKFSIGFQVPYYIYTQLSSGLWRVTPDYNFYRHVIAGS
jgi:hypothetical protein